MSSWERLRRAMRLPSVEHDVNDELQFHLEARTRDLIASGCTVDEARRIAESEFGDLNASRRELADVDRTIRARMRRAGLRDTMAHDARAATRALTRAPGITLVVALLLALGVGANAATFAIADQLFMHQPAGVVHPDEVRRFVARTHWGAGPHDWAIRSEQFYATFSAMATAVGSRATLAGYTKPDSLSAVVDGSRGFVRISYVTAQYFPMLGVSFALGRPISPDEGTMGNGAAVAVISNSVWESRFEADRNVLGKSIELGGQRFTVIGVTSPEFTGVDLDRVDVWVPYAMLPWGWNDTGPWYTNWRMNLATRVIGRVPRYVTDQAVAAIATAAYRTGERDHVSTHPDTTATILPAPLLESLGPTIHPSVQSAITARLAGIALMVLLVAAANAANLLLLRATRRQRETAIRLALGISRGRLLRQGLMESVMLGLFVASLSIALGAWGGAVLRAMLLPEVHWASSTLSPRLVLVSIAVALVSSLATGVLPVTRMLDAGISGVLGGRSNATTQRRRLRATLLVVQTAFSVILLVGAGLFVRSLGAVESIDSGYQADRFLVHGRVYFRDSATHVVDYFNESRPEETRRGLLLAADRLRSSASVEAVALASSGPMSGYSSIGAYFSDRRPVPRVDDQGATLLSVSPEYFGVTGIQLVAGRLLVTGDSANSDHPILVNETMARSYWPGRNALGQCLVLFRETSPCSTVVGVVRDAHLHDLIEKPVASLFRAMGSGKGSLDHPSVIVVRARPGRTAAALSDLRRELIAAFPNSEPPDVSTFEADREPELRPWRLGAKLFSAFGLLALAIATMGVFSLLSYSVTERTHEIGVRMALGARAGQVAAMIVRQAIGPVGVGALIGIGLSLALGRFVAAMLYGTTPSDPLVMSGVVLILLMAGVMGAVAPATRAAGTSPSIALRSD